MVALDEVDQAALLDPLNSLRQLDARHLDDVPESALADGTLWRLAQSATDAAPTSVWAWQQRAHYASICALTSVETAEQERWWDDCIASIDALALLPDRQAYEVVLVDTIAHATGLRERYDDWAARHDIERRVIDLRHVRLARDAVGRPRGWGFVQEQGLRARRMD